MRSGVLALLGALVLNPFSRAPGQLTPARYVLHGRVTDTSGAAIPRAQIHLRVGDSLTRMTLADSSGVFLLDGLAAGAVSILVRRLGYQSRVYSVDVGDETKRLEAVLAPRSRELNRMRISARGDPARGKLREFYEHRQRAQLGYFLDPEEIDKRRPTNPSDLLRHLPGVRLLPWSGVGSQVRLRGCRPVLWVDAVRLPDAEVDETVSASDIAAVEVYGSLTGTPAQYVDRETNCGALVIWTRS